MNELDPHGIGTPLDEYASPERLATLYGLDISYLEDCSDSTPTLPLVAFGRWEDWLDTAARDAGCPVDFVAATLIACASAAIGNARGVSASSDGWHTQPHVIWMALVGEPSVGKSPGLRACVEALKRVERDDIAAYEPERLKHEEAQEVAKAKLAAWREAVASAVHQNDEPPACPPDATPPSPIVAPQIVVGDTTPEALTGILAGNTKGVVLQRDELAGFLGGFDRYKGGGSERAMFLEAYDAGSFTVSRKSGGTVCIPRMAVSICGGLQPERFAGLIAKTDDDGLQARFLYVYPQRRPFVGRPKERTDRERLYRAFRRLRDLQLRDGDHGPEPVILPLSDAAATNFESWLVQHDAGHRGGSSRYQSWRGKASGKVLRLALILELLDWAFEGAGHVPSQVSDLSLTRAVYLHDEYFTQMTQKTFVGAALSETERNARSVLLWIAGHRGSDEMHSLSVREVYKIHRIAGIKTPREAEDALNALAEAGWLVRNPRREDGKPGRNSITYDVRQDVWEFLSEWDRLYGSQ